MSDPLSFILSQLSGLTTFKAAFRMLLIVAGILVSWIFLYPILIVLDIPNEISVPVAIVCGFSGGVILASIIYSLYELFIERRQKKDQEKKLNKELILLEEKREEHNLNKLNGFIESFESYSVYSKMELRKLTFKDSVITFTEFALSEKNTAIKGLIDNEIIIKIHKIEKLKTLYALNPLYKNHLQKYFNNEFNEDVDNLLRYNHNELMSLLSLFKEKTHHEDHVFKIGVDLYSKRLHFTPVILYENYFDEGFNNCNFQFYINEHHYPILCRKVSEELRSYVLALFDENLQITPTQ